MIIKTARKIIKTQPKVETVKEEKPKVNKTPEPVVMPIVKTEEEKTQILVDKDKAL